MLATSCEADYALNRDFGSDGQVPIVRFEPDNLDFGSLAPGESTALHTTLHNDGDGNLVLESLVVSGSSDFVLSTIPAADLAPGASMPVEISFAPNSNRAGGDLVLTSNDPARPTATVDLKGVGLFPAVGIWPNPLSLGGLEPGCPRQGEVALVNTGEADLEIASTTIWGEGFRVAQAPPFPIVLPPGESVSVSIEAVSPQAGDLDGRVYVASNDPAGIRTSEVSASVGSSPTEATDGFRQALGSFEAADILVYVDQSCSMSDDQARLAANFATFAGNLEALQADWQLIVANGDDGCHEGDLLTPYDPDGGSKFLSYVSRGGGSDTERGLSVAKRAIVDQHTGCNQGFLRNESLLAVLLVSDEPEQSSERWDVLADEILKHHPSSIVAAICGPTPNGCATAAPGTGYVEASEYTHGINREICAEDWGDYFVDISALASGGIVDRFALSFVPDMASLVVTVNAVEVYGWGFVAETNEVIFETAAIPAAGSYVEAEYVVAHGCAE